MITFEQSVISVNEGSQVEVHLVFSNPSSTNIPVKVQNNYVTATGMNTPYIFYKIIIYVGFDYVIGPYSITFPTGMIRASFSISIRNDNNYKILQSGSQIPIA